MMDPTSLLLSLSKGAIEIKEEDNGAISLRPTKSKWNKFKILTDTTLRYFESLKGFVDGKEKNALELIVGAESITNFMSEIYDAVGTGGARQEQLNKSFQAITTKWNLATTDARVFGAQHFT